VERKTKGTKNYAISLEREYSAAGRGEKDRKNGPLNPAEKEKDSLSCEFG